MIWLVAYFCVQYESSPPWLRPQPPFEVPVCTEYREEYSSRASCKQAVRAGGYARRAVAPVALHSVWCVEPWPPGRASVQPLS